MKMGANVIIVIIIVTSRHFPVNFWILIKIKGFQIHHG